MKSVNLNTTGDQPRNGPLAHPRIKRNDLSSMPQHVVHLDGALKQVSSTVYSEIMTTETVVKVVL